MSWNQQLFEMIGRSMEVSRQRGSKAASISLPAEEEMVTISMKEYSKLLKQDGQRRESKAASVITTETVRMPLKEYRELVINQTIRKSKAASVSANGINKNQAKVIHDLLNRR